MRRQPAAIISFSLSSTSIYMPFSENLRSFIRTLRTQVFIIHFHRFTFPIRRALLNRSRLTAKIIRRPENPERKLPTPFASKLYFARDRPQLTNCQQPLPNKFPVRPLITIYFQKPKTRPNPNRKTSLPSIATSAEIYRSPSATKLLETHLPEHPTKTNHSRHRHHTNNLSGVE